jgi:Zn-finger nucleic acid-binding protein
MNECPRCRSSLDEARLARGGGPFRSAHVEVTRCRGCGVIVLDPNEAKRFLADPELGGDATERDRKPTRLACATPHCFANLDEVTLGWGQKWVVLEQCPRCHLLLADPGELEAVTGLRRL